MADKQTLKKESGGVIFPIVVAIICSILTTYMMLNQIVMSSLVEVEPISTIPTIGVVLVYWCISMGIILGVYYSLKKNRIVSSVFYLIAGLFALAIPGKVYNPEYLIQIVIESGLGIFIQQDFIVSGFYSLYMFVTITSMLLPVKKETGTYGTAEIQKGDKYIIGDELGQDDRIIFGRHLQNSRLLSYQGDRHMCTMAPTGGGKGVGVIIPNLLNYPYNVVVIDPKGENCNFTSDYRQKHLGQKIICLDPFRESIWGKKNGTNHFNPLDAIPSNYQEAFDPCMDIVDIVFSKEMKGDPFWINRAKGLYLGFLTYVCTAPEYNDPKHPNYSPELRNLSTINHLFSIPVEDLMLYIKKISSSELPLSIKKFANEILTAAGSEKMMIGIMETLKSEIQIFHSPEISSVMQYSDFSYDKAITGKATIYLIVPSEKLETYSKWIRVVLTMFLRRAVSVRKRDLSTANDQRMLFLLDEFANLGKLSVVREYFSLVRGYGIKFWIIIQDLSQIQTLYERSWKTFISQSGIFQVFGTNDIDTAEYISKTVGETTVVSVSQSNNKSGMAGGGLSRGSSKTEQRRRVYTADEIRRIPPEQQLIIVEGENPILAKRIRYYQDETFKELTPKREEVFAKIKELPRQFKIKDETADIEKKIRLLILEVGNLEMQNDSDLESEIHIARDQETKRHDEMVQKPQSIDNEIDSPGSDIDIIM